MKFATSRRSIAELTAVAGAALALGAVLTWGIMWGGGGPEALFPNQVKKLHLVEDMRLGLAKSEEAEKSAVLADTDEASEAFAKESRLNTQAVAKNLRELSGLVQAGGSAQEKDLLGQLTQAFGEFERIDADLLDLAVRNSNLKAQALTFGPGAKALEDFDQAMAGLAQANLSTPQAAGVLGLTCRARNSLLRVQALLPAHIAEASDEKMDQLEKLIQDRDAQASQAIEALSATAALQGRAGLDKAREARRRYMDLTANILALSRENTNVRSLAMSLNQKRKVSAACQEILTALAQAEQNRGFKATR